MLAVRFAAGSDQLLPADAARLRTLAATGGIAPADRVTVAVGGAPVLADSRFDTIAATLDASVQRDVYYARARGYKSARESALFADNVPLSVYDNLIDSVHRNLPAVHRYYDVRRRKMKLADIHQYDTYVPILSDLDKRHSWDQAVKVVVQSLEPLVLARLARHVRDPALREALTPRYRMGCKRVLISNDFYPAMQRRNVQLVTTPVERVVADGVITADGTRHPLDVLVMATGFQAADAMAPYPVRGRRGAELNQVWRDGARAYLGTTVPGFPNLFLIVGPNTGLGHNSMVVMIESQIRYVIDALARMDRARLAGVDAKADVAAAFNERLQQRMKRTVWSTGGCTSWYQSKSGLITTLWPGTTLEYRLRTRRFRLADYEPLRA